MKDLKFCPKCGDDTLIWDGEKKLSCDVCDYVMFHNCAAAVAVVIKCGDEFLFTKRNQEPAKNKLDLAGGFVDPKESAEDASARELFEEMNLKIDKKQLKFICSLPNVYRYKNIDYNTLDLFFEYSVKEKFQVKLDVSEISEVVWIKKDALKIDNLAFESQKQFFKMYFDYLNF